MRIDSTTSEFVLIKECLKGDRKSQKELYEIYAPHLFPICLRYSKDKATAEDMMQEAFIKIFNNLSSYRGEGSLLAWLKRVTVHCSIEVYNRSKKAAFVTFEEEPTFICKEPTGLDKLQEQDIVRLTDKLSDGYRDVFKLYAIEGYSHKEIAKIYNITESTSKSQYHRAKIALKGLIATR